VFRLLNWAVGGQCLGFGYEFVCGLYSYRSGRVLSNQLVSVIDLAFLSENWVPNFATAFE